MPVRLDRDLPLGALNNVPDFWRSGATNVAGTLPDGVADTTELIHREGRTAIQSSLGAVPTFVNGPMLDIANGVRSGTDRRSTLDPLYVTGNLDPGSGNWADPRSAWYGAANGVGKLFFGHTNQTAGFAIGYQTIAQVSGTLDFCLQADQGIHSRQNLQLNGGWMYDMQVLHPSAVPANAQGFQARWRAENGDRLIELRRKLTTLQGGALGYEQFWQRQAPNGGFQNVLRSTWSFQSPNTPSFSVNPGNLLGDQLLIMYGDAAANFGTYGFGMRGSEMTAWIASGSTFTTRRTDTQVPIVSIDAFGASGDVVIDPSGVVVAGFANGLFRFGALGSGEGIKSQRVGAGPNLNAIEFYTNSANRVAFRQNGHIFIALTSVPVFASDAAAGVGGMLQGELYRDALGGIHIKL